MVSVLAYNSDNLSSNPAKVKIYREFVIKRTKLNKKEAEVGPFLKLKLWVVANLRRFRTRKKYTILVN